MISYQHAAAWGIFLVVTGIVVCYKIGKRRFNRRNLAGLEWFPSYSRAVLTRLAEGLFGLLAKLMILTGLLLLLAASL
jgi:hypothetical protein